MVHDLGHRTETMTRVYRGWQQDDISSNWSRFGLADAQSLRFPYRGYGLVRYPPNDTSS